MTRSELLKMYKNNLINRMELDDQFKEMDDDMLQAHGGTFNCGVCHYTRHVDCPVYCNN